jgi:hypothetical protein
MIGRFIVGLLLVGLCACATVPMASPELDAAAKRFEAPADRARIYVVRASSIGTAILFQVSLDDRILGSLPIHTFLVADVAPGNHTVTALSEENESSITLDAEPGKSYYLRVGPRPGWMDPRVAIYQLDDAEGRRVVKGASLAKGRAPAGQ